MCGICGSNQTYIDKKGTLHWYKTENGYSCKRCAGLAYYHKNAIKMSEQANNWRKNNPERSRANKKRWELANPEKCRLYDRRYRENHPEKIKQLNSQRIKFNGKLISLGFNPRTGICSKCGKTGKTNMHHEKYDESNPLAHTLELCLRCHMARHRGGPNKLFSLKH